MTVTSGFFNSVNHDRKYNAEEISSIFDGIILDGVYQGFGEAFKVEGTSTANQVKIGTGRAWFNHTWTLNDEALYLTLPAPNSTYPRIDAIVLEVNNSSSVRANTIKYISGSAASSPAKPSLTNTTDVHQYPLAYITRPKATTTVSAGNIENAIGTSACPIVTGVLEVLDDDRFIAQTIANLTTDFNTWFEGIKDTLDGDTAGNLLNKINENYDDLSKKIQTNSDNIYRLTINAFDITKGRNLGSTVTEDQLNSIKALDKTIYPGDYWIIDDAKYVILGYDLLNGFAIKNNSMINTDKHYAVVISSSVKEETKNISQEILSKSKTSLTDDTVSYIWSFSPNMQGTNGLVPYANYNLYQTFIKNPKNLVTYQDDFVNKITDSIGNALLDINWFAPQGLFNYTMGSFKVIPLSYLLFNPVSDSIKTLPSQYIYSAQNSGIPEPNMVISNTTVTSVDTTGPISTYYDLIGDLKAEIDIERLSPLYPDNSKLISYLMDSNSAASCIYNMGFNTSSGYPAFSVMLSPWIYNTNFNKAGSRLATHCNYNTSHSVHNTYERMVSTTDYNAFCGTGASGSNDKYSRFGNTNLLIPTPVSSAKISNVKVLDSSNKECEKLYFSWGSTNKSDSRQLDGVIYTYTWGKRLYAYSSSAGAEFKMYRNSSYEAYPTYYTSTPPSKDPIYVGTHVTYDYKTATIPMFCIG